MFLLVLPWNMAALLLGVCVKRSKVATHSRWLCCGQLPWKDVHSLATKQWPTFPGSATLIIVLMKQNWSLTSASLHDHDSEHGFTFPVHKKKHSKDGRKDLQGTKPGKRHWLWSCLSKPKWQHLSFEVLPLLKRLHLSTGLHALLLFFTVLD